MAESVSGNMSVVVITRLLALLLLWLELNTGAPNAGQH